jgi:tetratricopeptide (TPR) repeat protein
MPAVPSESSRSIADLLAAGEEAFADAAFCTGDFSVARGLIEEVLRRATTEGDRSSEVLGIERLGLLLHYENITKRMSGVDVSDADVDTEKALFQQALDMRREMSDDPGAALPLFGLGLVAQVLRRDWGTAIPYFREALALVEASGDAIDLYTQSEVHRHIGFYYLVEDIQLGQALRHLQRSLDLREQLGDPRRIPSGLEVLGQAELASGNTTRGVDLLEQAVTQARAANLMPDRIDRTERALEEAKAKLSQ